MTAPRASEYPDESPRLMAGGRLLVVNFTRPHRTLSWAVVGGGYRRSSAVVWRRVDNNELGIDIDPRQLLQSALAEAGLDDAVGLLTSRDLSRFAVVSRTSEGRSARCVATVGLGNALAVGDPPGPLRTLRPVGTINLLCQLSCGVTEEALIEAVAIAAEARTAALLAASLPSGRSARTATGTGTDCIVVAAPDEAPAESYIGKHTLLGALLGESIRLATARGISAWLADQKQ